MAMIDLMGELGKVAGRGALGAAKLKERALEAASKAGMAPEDLVAAGERAVEDLRTRNPELMAKVSDAAAKAVGKTGEYLPGVVERARTLVDRKDA